MKLHILDLPDTREELIPWLEARFLGPELPELVAQLEDLRPAAAKAGPALGPILDQHGPALLKQGLSALPEAALWSLIADPQRLFELQDWVLTADSRYWNALVASAEDLQLSKSRGEAKWSRFLADESSNAPAPAAKSGGKAAWYASPPWVAMATAAVMLLAFRLVMDQKGVKVPGADPNQVAQAPIPPPVGWGWNNPDSLKQDVAADVYLTNLANGADAWFKKRPEDNKALAKRIGEFRRGCSELLLAEHQPLAEEDKAWLLERCKVWAGKFDGFLAAAESGADVQKTLAEMDETVNKLITALRTRADGLKA